MNDTQIPDVQEEVRNEKNLRSFTEEDVMNGERSRTQSGQWRRKRSDAGKKKKKKKSFWDVFFE